MFNPLGGLGDLQKLQQQAQQMQAALQQEQVVVEKNGVKVQVRGDQIIEVIEVDGVIEIRIVFMLKLFAGTANPKLSLETAILLKIPLSNAEVVRFENSEVKVIVKEK